MARPREQRVGHRVRKDDAAARDGRLGGARVEIRQLAVLVAAQIGVRPAAGWVRMCE